MKSENSAGAVPGAAGSFERKTLTSLGMPGPEPTMMLSAVDAVDLRSGHADAAARRRIESLEAGKLGRERRLAVLRLARIGDDLRRVVLAGADDEIVDAVVVDVAHGDARRALKAGKGVTVATSRSPLPS